MFPLSLEQVTIKRGGKTVLGPIDLQVSQGGPSILIGPNGAGKTTLLRAMHGIERLSSGKIQWAETDQGNHAFVFQSPIVMRRSVVQNLCYPLELIGTPKQEITAAITHWITRIGLDKVKHTSATRLSGGERQKLAIARALIRKPKLLFLDEPCANLDGRSVQEIEQLLLETAAQGTRIIMSTHDMGQARRLARDVIFLVAGKIIEQGDAQTCLNTPHTPQLKAFLNGDILS